MTAADRERWERRYREGEGDRGEAEPWLLEHRGDLRPGSVLDVAAGAGGNALALARAGFAVSALDIAPTALERLAVRAAAEGLTIATRLIDLDDPAAFGDLGPFANLVVIRYKPDAAQWTRLLRRLAPGGRLFLCSFGLEEHTRSGFPKAFCLDRSELETTLSPPLHLLTYERFRHQDRPLEGSIWQRPPD